jgi:hypothetical protein
MTYTLIYGSTAVKRDSDQATIPAVASLVDWQEYQAWLTAGNTPTPAPVPPPPPVTLTFIQFMALFTPAEQDAIIDSTDTQTRVFMAMATGSGGLQLSNAEVIAGVGYLAALPTATPPGPALIAPARVAQILANQPPG